MLTYRVEVSDDLMSWQSGANAVEEVEVSRFGEWPTVRVRERPSAEAAPRRFMRVKVIPMD